MEGKPFAVIETDGHSGDAGTKTRVEAFLHCVEEDRRAAPNGAVLNDFESVQFSGQSLAISGKGTGKHETLLISSSARLGGRGRGFSRAGIERRKPSRAGRGIAAPRPPPHFRQGMPADAAHARLAVQRLERAPADEKFVFLMPSTDGPCRFGAYNLLNHIVLDRLGWRDRVRIWSPNDTGYFDDMPAGTEMLVFAGMAASDFLLQAKFDVRPVELKRGETEKLYERCRGELLAQIESAAGGDLSLGAALWQVAGGKLFGLREILQRAGREFAALRGPGERPCVELTGEIYVRGVEFSNDSLIEKLEARGLRVTRAENRMGQLLRPHAAANCRAQPIRGWVQPSGSAAHRRHGVFRDGAAPGLVALTDRR